MCWEFFFLDLKLDKINSALCEQLNEAKPQSLNNLLFSFNVMLRKEKKFGIVKINKDKVHWLKSWKKED